MDVDTTKLRLEGVEQALQRSRLCFIVIIVISLSIAIAVWNFYLSWDRMVVVRGVDSFANKALMDQVVSQWVKSNQITPQLLGIQISVSDATILGTIALVIAGLWQFYSARRENLIVGTLLIDSQKEPENVRWLVFHGIVAASVFIIIPGIKPPIYTLSNEGSSPEPFPDYLQPQITNFLRKLIELHAPWFIRFLDILANRSIETLSFLPPITILFTGIMQALGLIFMESPFHVGKSLAESMTLYQWFYCLMSTMSAALGLALSLYLAHAVVTHHRSMAHALESYYKLLILKEEGIEARIQTASQSVSSGA